MAHTRRDDAMGDDVAVGARYFIALHDCWHGRFRRIWRWWTRGVARTTLGDVASIDVVASPTTLGGWLVPTLGSWRFSRIAVSWLIALACLHFSSAEVGTIDRMCSMRSEAAMMVRSSSERVGTLQCVG